MRKIIHISSLSPPPGGIGKFLNRLKEYTDSNDERNKYLYVDTSGKYVEEKEKKGIICLSKAKVPFFLLKQKSAFIIFHSNSAMHLLLNLLFCWKHKFIYFTHGESILKEKNKRGWRHLILKNAGYIVTPTEELEKKVADIFPKKAEICTIPFVLYPKKISALENEEIAGLRVKTDFIFSVYANNLSEFKGCDLYGIDIAIEAIGKLRQLGYNVGLVALISSINDNEKYLKYLKRIEELGLSDYVILWNQLLEEGASLFVSSDCYLRPTNTDGDSFAVWEALHFGVPVLASDASQRPRVCMIFKTRDLRDMVDKAVTLINGYPEIRKKVKAEKIEGNGQQLMEFFESF